MRIILILLLLCLVGCDSASPDPEDFEDTSIDFSALEVGQESRYVSFEGGSTYDPENAVFEYINDTLIVEVIERNGNEFIFLETVLPGQSLRFWEDSLRYRVTVAEDFLAISSLDGERTRSNLFLIADPIPLTPLEENQAELEGIVLTTAVQDLEQSGFVLNHTQQGVYFGRLNFVVDASSIVFDGPAYTVVYNKKAGIVRAFSVSPWTGTGFGWDLVP